MIRSPSESTIFRTRFSSIFMVSKVRRRGGMGGESCRGRKLKVIETRQKGWQEKEMLFGLGYGPQVTFHLFYPLKDEVT